MKKVLIIHNKYREEGGEDLSVQNEIEFLKSEFNVKTLFFNNYINSKIKQSIYFILNKNLESKKILKKSLREFQPDVVYVHNTWFKASPAIFKVLSKSNINTIVKIHNFRYSCTQSFLLRKHLKNDVNCNACGMENKNTILFNKYFPESYLKSIFVIRYSKKFLKILKSQNFKIAVLTKFHRQFLNELGIDNKKIYIFPNYLQNNTKIQRLNTKNYLVYAGRISKEKGIKELIESFLKVKNKNMVLKIIGNGPYFDELKALYSIEFIEFLGQLKNEEVHEIISNSTAVVTATKLFEGQPTLLCEASMFSVPSIFPSTGGIEEFFPQNYPLSFEQFNYEDLENKLKLLKNDESNKMIGRSNKHFLLEYLNKEKLISKFNLIINEK